MAALTGNLRQHQYSRPESKIAVLDRHFSRSKCAQCVQWGVTRMFARSNTRTQQLPLIRALSQNCYTGFTNMFPCRNEH